MLQAGTAQVGNVTSRRELFTARAECPEKPRDRPPSRDTQRDRKRETDRDREAKAEEAELTAVYRMDGSLTRTGGSSRKRPAQLVPKESKGSILVRFWFDSARFGAEVISWPIFLLFIVCAIGRVRWQHLFRDGPG